MNTLRETRNRNCRFSSLRNVVCLTPLSRFFRSFFKHIKFLRSLRAETAGYSDRDDEATKQPVLSWMTSASVPSTVSFHKTKTRNSPVTSYSPTLRPTVPVWHVLVFVHILHYSVCVCAAILIRL